jgi:hypothetical protein
MVRPRRHHRDRAHVDAQAGDELDSRILIEDARVNEPALLVGRDRVKRLDSHERI